MFVSFVVQIQPVRILSISDSPDKSQSYIFIFSEIPVSQSVRTHFIRFITSLKVHQALAAHNREKFI